MFVLKNFIKTVVLFLSTLTPVCHVVYLWYKIATTDTQCNQLQVIRRGKKCRGIQT